MKIGGLDFVFVFLFIYFFCLVNISDKSLPPPVPSHSNRCYVPVCETTTSQLQISVIYRKIKENPDYAMHFFKNQSIFNHRFGCRQVINIQSCMSLCVHKSWPYNNKIFDDVLETKNVKKVKMLLIYMYPLFDLRHDRALVNTMCLTSDS